MTLLAASLGVYIAWRLLSAVWPPLLVLAAVLLVLRLATGLGRRRW